LQNTDDLCKSILQHVYTVTGQYYAFVSRDSIEINRQSTPDPNVKNIILNIFVVDYKCRTTQRWSIYILLRNIPSTITILKIHTMTPSTLPSPSIKTTDITRLGEFREQPFMLPSSYYDNPTVVRTRQGAEWLMGPANRSGVARDVVMW
jgi:hypothetical protein